MNKLLLVVAISLTLASGAAEAGGSRDHRGGQTSQGGVSVGGPVNGHGGGRAREDIVVKVAPQVPHESNWGIPGPGRPYGLKFPENVRDHRGYCHTC